MKSSSKWIKVIFALSLFGFFTAHAHAIPSANLTYVETQLGNGWWQYDYTLFNTSNPGLYQGFDLYDLTIYFDPSSDFTLVALPDGWDVVGGTSDSGFATFFSEWLGTPPDGSDIAPGSSLGGFIFQFGYRVGALPFDVSFVNPDDFENPAIYADTSSNAVGAPVPEPSTLVLIGVGLGGVGLFRRKWRIQ